jgi:Protein of unknown function (DUF2924)
MGSDLKVALAKLAGLDHAALKQRWLSLHGREPPAGSSRPLLRYGIAYRLQEKAQGSLRPATRRYLEQVAAEGKLGVVPITTVRPGTRLLREWHGVTYEVIVLDQGVMFKGERYRSLSEVARVITGAKWSGPVFFGIRKKVHG